MVCSIKISWFSNSLQYQLAQMANGEAPGMPSYMYTMWCMISVFLTYIMYDMLKELHAVAYLIMKILTYMSGCSDVWHKQTYINVMLS